LTPSTTTQYAYKIFNKHLILFEWRGWRCLFSTSFDHLWMPHFKSEI